MFLLRIFVVVVELLASLYRKKITTTKKHTLSSSRKLYEAGAAAALMEMNLNKDENTSRDGRSEGRNDIWDSVWASGAKTMCRALVLDHSGGDSQTAAA